MNYYIDTTNNQVWGFNNEEEYNQFKPKDLTPISRAPLPNEVWNGTDWEVDIDKLKSAKITELETNKKTIFNENYTLTQQQDDNLALTIYIEASEAGATLSADDIANRLAIRERLSKVVGLNTAVATLTQSINDATTVAEVEAISINLTW